MTKNNFRSNCPLNVGIETFGDRWSLLIIRDLMFFGKRHYNEFLVSHEGIATNLLADRLKRLEEVGIIWKSKDPSHKQKIRYSLTEKGIDLLPIIVEIGMWSEKYFDDLAANRDLVLGPYKKKGKRGLEEVKEYLKVQHS